MHFFDISTSKSGPRPPTDLEMCFAPQRRALFRHLNFQKWSEAEVFWTKMGQTICYYKKRCSINKSCLGVNNFKGDYLYNNGSISVHIVSIIWLVLIKWGLRSINRSVMIKWCFGLLYRQHTIWENTMAGHAWPSYFPMSFFEEVWGKKSWNMPLK